MIKMTLSMLLLLATTNALANPQHRQDKGPPPEAIEACADQEKGTVVSFETPRGETLEATCRLMHEQLIAVPNNHKRKRRQEERQEN